MLHIGHEKVPVCSGPSRRSFLQAGAAGLAGISLPNFMQLEASGAVDYSKAKIKNCITLFLVGSPGHLDTWDMKPDARKTFAASSSRSIRTSREFRSANIFR